MDKSVLFRESKESTPKLRGTTHGDRRDDEVTELDAPSLLLLIVGVVLLGALVSVDAKISSIRNDRGLGRSSGLSFMFCSGDEEDDT